MALFRRRPRDPSRQKTERYRGWWQAVDESPCPGVHGKIEWDGFASGDAEIDLFARVPDIPDGGVVTVTWGDTIVLSATARKTVVSRELETKDGDVVPRLADQHVEMRYEGHVIARTHLVPE